MVMNNKCRLFVLLLTVSMVFSFGLTSCASLKKEPIKPYKNFAEDEPYRITYTTEEGVEGCVAVIEYHPYYEKKFVLEIPDADPNGRPVTKVVCNAASVIPSIVLEEDFREVQEKAEKYYGVTYEDAQVIRYDRNNPLVVNSFYLCKFMSYFVYKSKAQIETMEFENEEQRERMLHNLVEAFPVTDSGVGIYVIDKAVTAPEYASLYGLLLKMDSDWSDAWSYENALNVQEVCEGNSVEDPNLERFLDDYSGLGEGLTDIKWPSSLVEIGDVSFMGSKSLTNVTIPGTVKTVGEGAFACCKGLEKIAFSEGVVSVGNYVLHDWDSLETITFPVSLESLGYLSKEDEIAKLEKLPTIYYNGTMKQWEKLFTTVDLDGTTQVNYYTYNYFTINCADGVIEATQSTTK